MGQNTTYRASFRVRGDAESTMAALVSHLPLSSARRTKFGWYDMPALIADGVSFSGLIPEDELAEPYWRLDGERLTFAADLLNPSYRDDNEPECEIGEPSRQSRVLEALSRLCAEPDGTIVGGWQAEHSDDWNPLLVNDGRVVFAYGRGHLGGREPDRLFQHPGRVAQGAFNPETGHVDGTI